MDNAYYNLNDIFIDNSRLKRTFFQYTYMYHIKHRYQPNMILELVHPDYLKFKVNYIRLNTLNILQNRMGDTKKNWLHRTTISLKFTILYINPYQISERTNHLGYS